MTDASAPTEPCVKCRGTGIIPGSIPALDQHCDCKDYRATERVSALPFGHAAIPVLEKFNKHFFTDGGKFAYIGVNEYRALVLAINPPPAAQSLEPLPPATNSVTVSSKSASPEEVVAPKIGTCGHPALFTWHYTHYERVPECLYCAVTKVVTQSLEPLGDAAAEREACAALCELLGDDKNHSKTYRSAAYDCMNLIRSRGAHRT